MAIAMIQRCVQIMHSLTADPQAFEQGKIFFASECPNLKALFLSFAIRPLIDFS